MIQSVLRMERQGGDTRVLEDLRRFGDRTSAFMTLYPGFRSYLREDGVAGQIRFVETSRAWVAGTEPIAAAQDRATLFEEFDAQAANRGKSSIMTPVTERLSRELVERGWRRIQVGAEPVFELSRYFSQDPLEWFPQARSLAKRGAQVREILPEQRGEPSLERQLQDLIESWLGARATVPLGFLNQIDPWRLGEHKKLFVVEQRKKILAFLSAVPVFARNGYFFADYIRAPRTKAGAVELLFIESMRSLQAQGVSEVRLGMCPLARLEPNAALTGADRLALRAMDWYFRHGAFPMSFASIYDFKAKFKPTSWESLYLVSRNPISFSTLREVFRIHFPESTLKAYLVALGRRLRNQLNPAVQIRAFPSTPAQLLSRTRFTLFCSAIFAALHALRTFMPQALDFYRHNPFTPSAYSLQGHFVAPLFHNTHYHFGGDVLTFLVFAGLLEIALGTGLCFLVVAAGLWASNPLTWGLVELTLKPLSSQFYARFLAETDYGSSNAVYAAVGALAPLLAHPRWLLTPFALNGMFLCLAHQSWLSLHHLVALASGYAICLLFLKTESRRVIKK